MWKYMLIAVCCHGLANGEFTIPTIEFQRNCGSTLRENVMNLVFDADDLPSYLYDKKCSVTIMQPDDTSYMMFYFEEYELSSSSSYPYSNCRDTNLTITEGTFNRRTTVPGLADTICGENKTLLTTYLNFTTSKQELTLTYSYSDVGKQMDGRLSIKLFAFHKDTKCDGDEDYMCSDNTCVRKEYHCSGEINVCPIDEVSCETISIAEGILEQITNIAKNVGWIVFIVVIFYIVGTFYKTYKARIWGFINDKCRQGPRDSNDDEAARTSLQLELEDVSAPVRPPEPEPVQPDRNIHNSRRTSMDSSLCSSVSLPDISVTSPDDTTSPITQPHLPTPGAPSAPPPSYEEVMAPSYDDVMANEHKYKASSPH